MYTSSTLVTTSNECCGLRCSQRIILRQVVTRQSAPAFLDAISEFLNETVVDDWVYRVVDVVAIGEPW